MSVRDLWIEQKARRIGYPTVAAFRDAFSLKSYRLDQLYRGAAHELAAGVADLTVLPTDLRERLDREEFAFSSVVPVEEQRSSDGSTTKTLFRLADGSEVESVLMEHHRDRNTVCISSQAGCAYACAFCSTGQAGFTRHLEAAEIFDQARYFAQRLRPRRVTNIVFMGMGEPFQNYDAVMGAVSLLNDPKGFGLGHRHITISTVGLVPEIDKFANEEIQVNLAISLHAPNDEIRSQIMPVNRRYPVAELLAACDRYIEKTNRKIFFEYLMLAGVNDSVETARELASVLRGPLRHVNLIPYNATPDAPYVGSAPDAVSRFGAELDRLGIALTVRRPMGRDIAAACGQLRADTQPKVRERIAS